MRASVLSFALIAALPCAIAAQTTPWGDPDLQGVWSSQTPVPLERPAALANKPFFTEAEAAEVEKNALGSILKVVARGIPTSGELNEIWLETAKGKLDAICARHSSSIRRTGRFRLRRKAARDGTTRRRSNANSEAGSTAPTSRKIGTRPNAV
jgi:hypothetical protein